jgi:Tol biopolymer transport system component
LLAVDTGEYAGQPLHQADRFGDFFPGISPDGTKIAFARVSGLGVEDIYITPIGGGEAKRLTFDNTFTGGLAWTSDSREMVFLRCGKAIL